VFSKTLLGSRPLFLISALCFFIRFFSVLVKPAPSPLWGRRSGCFFPSKNSGRGSPALIARFPSLFFPPPFCPRCDWIGFCFPAESLKTAPFSLFCRSYFLDPLRRSGFGDLRRFPFFAKAGLQSFYTHLCALDPAPYVLCFPFFRFIECPVALKETPPPPDRIAFRSAF